MAGCKTAIIGPRVTLLSSHLRRTEGMSEMDPTAAEFIAEEKKFLGVPYVFGGESPSGFDCSSLVQYCLNAIGVQGCPRTSEEQWNWVERISYDQLVPGNLIFEQWPGDQAPPGHVVTFIGNGQVIEAPAPGQVVHIRAWSPAGDEADGAAIIGYGLVPGLTLQPPPGTWLVAFQDSSNQLWLRNSAGANNETGLAMALSAPSLSSG